MAKKYSLYQYTKMAEKFNGMSFSDKIKTIRDNSDLFEIGADSNWFCVKLKDKKVQQDLIDLECRFDIKKEWGHEEMYDLLNLLGINVTDYD